LPVAFIWNGEKYDNIRKFDSEEYINNFLGL
jgi:signal recognition particle GTPase